MNCWFLWIFQYRVLWFFFFSLVQMSAVVIVRVKYGSKDLHSYSCSFRALLQALLSHQALLQPLDLWLPFFNNYLYPIYLIPVTAEMLSILSDLSNPDSSWWWLTSTNHSSIMVTVLLPCIKLPVNIWMVSLRAWKKGFKASIWFNAAVTSSPLCWRPLLRDSAAPSLLQTEGKALALWPQSCPALKRQIRWQLGKGIKRAERKPLS